MSGAVQEFCGYDKKELISRFYGTLGLLMDGRSIIKIKDVSIEEYRTGGDKNNGITPARNSVDISFELLKPDAPVCQNMNRETGKPQYYSMIAVGKMDYGVSVEAKVSDICLISRSHGKSTGVSYSNLQ